MADSLTIPKFTAKAVRRIEEQAKQALRQLIDRDAEASFGSREVAHRKIDEWEFKPTAKNARASPDDDETRFDLVVDTKIGVETVVVVKGALRPTDDGLVHWGDLKGAKRPVVALNLYDPNE
jgi:hypothetical protein